MHVKAGYMYVCVMYAAGCAGASCCTVWTDAWSHLWTARGWV